MQRSTSPRFRALAFAASAALAVGLAGAATGQGQAGSGERFGLTESQRKAVFAELAGAERRAEKDAAARAEGGPGSQSRTELAQRLSREYRAAVARKHGLTDEQLVLIGAEGFEKSWSAR